MILSCHHITKAFQENVLFSDGTFFLEPHEKAAIVGINGAGKSTLLKIIAGETAADSGDVIFAKGATFGYLAQHQDLDEDLTVYEEMRKAKAHVIELERHIRQLEQDMKHCEGGALDTLLEDYNRSSSEFDRLDGYSWPSQITGVLKGLGFSEDEFNMNCRTLSGGQKTRVSLGKLLLTEPDVIMLDEPTNHLDIGSIAWLEGFLANYRGSVIIVAHDRYFIDKIVTKVIEISGGHLNVYSGNYTDYAEKKKARREAELKAYLNQQQYIRHQEEVIEKLKSFNREKSIKRAESREKMLAKVDRLERPEEIHDTMGFHMEPHVLSGNDVLTVSGLSKSFGENHLFADVSFQIRRGEHVAIIGDNGTGKTTLLKIINGLIPPDAGELELGSKVTIGYYDQEQQLLTDSNTLFDEIREAYPVMTDTEIRTTLAAFLFTGEDVFKEVKALSGGERGRLSLAKLMLSPCNFLILDEPTNHLDMTSKEVLEQAVKNYTGTVLYVSHDRYFVNQTASRILELTDHRFVNYIGNYDYYLEKKDAVQAAAGVSARTNGTIKDNAGSVRDWKSQKEEQARIRKLQSEKDRTEARISELEERDSAIDELLTHEDVYTDMEQCMKLQQEQAAVKDEIEALFARWEELEEALS